MVVFCPMVVFCSSLLLSLPPIPTPPPPPSPHKQLSAIILVSGTLKIHSPNLLTSCYLYGHTLTIFHSRLTHWCLLSTYHEHCTQQESDLGLPSRNTISHYVGNGGNGVDKLLNNVIMSLCYFASHSYFHFEFTHYLAVLLRGGLPLSPPPLPAYCSSRAWKRGIINIIKVLIKIEGVGHCVKCLILCIFNWLNV